MPSVDGACLGVQNLWETSGFLGAHVLRLKEKFNLIYKFSVEFIMNNILPVIFWYMSESIKIALPTHGFWNNRE